MFGICSSSAFRGSKWSESFEERRDALPATDAHSDEGITPEPACELVDGLDDEEAPGRADRMSQRDAAAVGIRLLRRELEIARDGDRLSGERLVQLNEIDVVDPHARALEQAAHGGNGTYAHVARLDARMRPAGEPRHRLEPARPRTLRRHQDDGRSRIVETGRVARGDAALRIEGGRELRERFHRRVAAHVLVLVEQRRALPRAQGDGEDLRIEPAVVDRTGRAAMALERERILLLARDA